MTTFDFLVVGAGSGGLAAARRAAELGARVGIIEQSGLGGTCVQRGCVPKKLLMYAACYGRWLPEAAQFGWPAAPVRFDFAEWQRRKMLEIARLEQHYRQQLERQTIAVITGQAQLLASGQLQVGSQTFSAPHILIATGSQPARDRIPGLDGCPTSDEVLNLTELPERVCILGGGYIGVELASLLTHLGAQVALHYRSELPLSGFDQQLRHEAAQNLAASGVHLVPKSVPSRIRKSDSGWQLDFDDQPSQQTPWLLNALGRTANLHSLGPGAALLERDAHTGRIAIDADFNTSLNGVYAVGDVANRHNLTPVAIAEGRMLANRLFAGQPVRPLTQIPTALFSLPPLASCGLNEQDCPPATLVFERRFRPMRAAFLGQSEQCYLKVLVDPASRRVLGVHLSGADAPEIIQSLAIALRAQATFEDFLHSGALHPTLAEEFVLLPATPSRVTG